MMGHGILSDHPAPLELQRFADDECTARERQTLATHLDSCTACRDRVAELRAVMEMVRREPIPPVPEHALARVLARRLAGEGRDPGDAFAAPFAKPGAHHRRKLVVGGALAAALLVAVLLPYRLREAQRAAMQPDDSCGGTPTSTAEDPMSSMAFRRYVAMAYGIPVTALSGCAADGPIGPLPTAPALAANAIRSAKLTDATLTYRETTILDSTLTHSVATRSVSIRRAVQGGTPFWLVVSNSDTMEMDIHSLHPRRVYRRRPPNEKGLSYAADLTTGAVWWLWQNGSGLGKNASRLQPRRIQLPDSERAAGGPLLLPIVLRALPLDAHWSASFEIFDPPWFFVGPYLRLRGMRLYRTIADVHVVGESRVRVPAGTFDCWHLRVQRPIAPGGPRDPEDMWVSKREGWIVRSHTTHGRDDDTVDHETVLVSAR